MRGLPHPVKRKAWLFRRGDASASVPDLLLAFGVPSVTKTPNGKLAKKGKNTISPSRYFCVSRPGTALGSGPDSLNRNLHFNSISDESQAFALLWSLLSWV